MTKETYPVSRQADIVIQELGSEILIYNLKINKAYCLNETSSLIWQACDGKKSISEISEQISRQIKSPVTEEFVFYALEKLKENDLLTRHEAVPRELQGLSRREVIRRIGLDGGHAFGFFIGRSDCRSGCIRKWKCRSDLHWNWNSRQLPGWFNLWKR